MTVPHLMNCPHTDDGWCMECVARLGNENWRQLDEIDSLRAALKRMGAQVVASDDRYMELVKRVAAVRAMQVTSVYLDI